MQMYKVQFILMFRIVKEIKYLNINTTIKFIILYNG